MKIVVAIKQVPARDSQLKIASSGQWIEEDDLTYEINEPDAYALEEGLQFKEKHGGEVVALCAGPARAAQTIREALAKGADRAIHIEEETGRARSAGCRRASLAAAIRTEAPDLVLTGLQSDDLGYGQTGVILAELLGLPHATIIMQVEKLRWRASASSASWRTAGSSTWRCRCPRCSPFNPASASCATPRSWESRRPRTKEIKRLTAADLGGASASPAIALDRVYLPERTKHTQLFEGSPKEAAAKLVEKLKFEARVI